MATGVFLWTPHISGIPESERYVIPLSHYESRWVQVSSGQRKRSKQRFRAQLLKRCNLDQTLLKYPFLAIHDHVIHLNFTTVVQKLKVGLNQSDPDPDPDPDNESSEWDCVQQRVTQCVFTWKQLCIVFSALCSFFSGLAVYVHVFQIKTLNFIKFTSGESYSTVKSWKIHFIHYSLLWLKSQVQK